MNQFLIDNIPYRAVYRDVGTEHEERGGCTSMQNGEFRLCEECELQKACPAEDEEE
jgi:hypothetical protein